MTENETASPHKTPAAQGPVQQLAQEVILTDDDEAPVAYANFARVMGTPEELILDFVRQH